MAWSGSWNGDRTAYTGTYTAPDGTVFRGTWTPAPSLDLPDPPDDPALSNDDPFFAGAPPNDRDAHQDHWVGLWHGGVWTGKFNAPGSIFEFAGTMTPTQG
jgi:hypothetical protein